MFNYANEDLTAPFLWGPWNTEFLGTHIAPVRFYQMLNTGIVDDLWNHFRAGCLSFSPQGLNWAWDQTINPKAVALSGISAWGFVAIPWAQLSLGPFLSLWKRRFGDGRPSVREVLSQPLLLRCIFCKPGESILWDTCSFPLCNDPLILYLTIPAIPRWTHSLAALLVHLKLHSNLDLPIIEQILW